MPEVLSVNYYNEIMKVIHYNLNNKKYKKVMWFGVSHMLPLIYDYLAADGYYISIALDNDPNKAGKYVERNWCMPFIFKYTSIAKEDVDKIIAGKVFPQLRIDLPSNIGKYAQDIKDILFFTASISSNEIKQQLLRMGAKEENIIVLSSEPECRDRAYDFLNNTVKNKIQLTSDEHKRILENILQIFKKFCEKEQLRYFLAYGTLIGAVRHKGFIPWDDDIDILMPVEDYIKLLEKFPKEARYEVLSCTTNDKYFFPFSKIVDNNTYLFHEGCPVTWVQGTYIDIFPMSGFEKEIDFETQWKYQTLLDVKWYWYYISRNILLEPIYDCRDEIISEKMKIGFDNAEKVGVLTTIPAKPWILDKSVFEKITKVHFEGHEYNAPYGYDEYLRYIYGDYMILPPVEKQRIHGYPSYRRLD